jgi:hypothetical protein
MGVRNNNNNNNNNNNKNENIRSKRKKQNEVFEAFTAVVMKSSIFWDVTPYSPVKVK